ncbi:MAG: hypothetical protein GY847_01095 [Proteobacteria bacterium]|nr:hypothetical protein [Pseudomonadota bacterium]
MSVFWGLSISKSTRMECALEPYIEQINLRTGDAGAWGLGYYSSGELLQRVEPRKQGEPLDVKEIAHGITADLIVMHTRMATIGPMRSENIHPFRFKEWIFAHNGTLTGFDTFKEKLCKTMPPFILRGILGDTDSEHLFHLFLAFLYDAGLLGRPDLGIFPIRDALSRAFATVDEFTRELDEKPSPGSVFVSDGYSSVVLSRGIPVDYVLIEGIRDCSVCRKSLRPGQTEASRIDHEDLRAVLVKSGSLEGPSNGFQRLNDDSFLMVTNTHGVEFSPFSS